MAIIVSPGPVIGTDVISKTRTDSKRPELFGTMQYRPTDMLISTERAPCMVSVPESESTDPRTTRSSRDGTRNLQGRYPKGLDPGPRSDSRRRLRPLGGPRGCSAGRVPWIQNRTRQLGLQFCELDGCAAGAKNEKGGIILKQWTIATDSERMRCRLSLRRSGDHQHAKIEWHGYVA